jgi:hypothetical protein
MLGGPSSAVLMCENRAAECEMLAALADSPDTERYYLGLAKGWLAYGKDHAFTETVDSILSGNGCARPPCRLHPRTLSLDVRLVMQNNIQQ